MGNVSVSRFLLHVILDPFTDAPILIEGDGRKFVFHPIQTVEVCGGYAHDTRNAAQCPE